MSEDQVVCLLDVNYKAPFKMDFKPRFPEEELVVLEDMIISRIKHYEICVMGCQESIDTWNRNIRHYANNQKKHLLELENLQRKRRLPGADHLFLSNQILHLNGLMFFDSKHSEDCKRLIMDDTESMAMYNDLKQTLIAMYYSLRDNYQLILIEHTGWRFKRLNDSFESIINIDEENYQQMKDEMSSTGQVSGLFEL